MSDLKPCPFCGGKAIARGSDVFGHWITCESCDCQLGYIWHHGYDSGLFGTAEAAIAAWNERAPA